MSAHTPGPWTLQPVGDETECNILGAGRELIATVSDNDARLIAAAPALLEALEHSLDWLASYPGGGAAVAYDKARAAIAQAKGK